MKHDTSRQFVLSPPSWSLIDLNLVQGAGAVEDDTSSSVLTRSEVRSSVSPWFSTSKRIMRSL